MNKGDIIENIEGVRAYYRGSTNKTGYKVYINNEPAVIPFNELHLWHYSNPIIDNRVVDSITFAVRFKQFLKWIPKEFYMSGPHILEEYEYMQHIADQLLNYQIETVTNENETSYLNRLGLL